VQHAEFVAIGIDHHHPIDVASADVDSSGPEGDRAVDLGSLITVFGRCDVKMQPILRDLRGR